MAQAVHIFACTATIFNSLFHASSYDEVDINGSDKGVPRPNPLWGMESISGSLIFWNLLHDCSEYEEGSPSAALLSFVADSNIDVRTGWNRPSSSSCVSHVSRTALCIPVAADIVVLAIPGLRL